MTKSSRTVLDRFIAVSKRIDHNTKMFSSATGSLHIQSLKDADTFTLSLLRFQVGAHIHEAEESFNVFKKWATHAMSLQDVKRDYLLQDKINSLKELIRDQIQCLKGIYRDMVKEMEARDGS